MPPRVVARARATEERAGGRGADRLGVSAVTSEGLVSDVIVLPLREKGSLGTWNVWYDLGASAHADDGNGRTTPLAFSEIIQNPLRCRLDAW